MSAINGADTTSKSASKKKKKSKKKTNGAAEASNVEAETNGVNSEQVADEEDDNEDDEASEAPAKGAIPNHVNTEDTQHIPSSPSVAADTSQFTKGSLKENDDSKSAQSERDHQSTPSSGTTARLEAMQQERDNLRAEVTQLRKSLESLQEKHEEELSNVKEELEQTQESKGNVETQYHNLLKKVNTIRSQLGDRLKADAAELEQARQRIEELETNDKTAKEENQRLQDSVATLTSEVQSQKAEIDNLRSRTTLSTSNWAKERDDLITREAYIKEEYEVAKQAMQDWEILATEERSRRETLEERMQEVEDQLNSQREAYERVKDEADTQSNTVDGLQRALRDLQDERKRELRELVEQSEGQLETLRTQTKTAEDHAAEVKAQLENVQKELERAAPFEKEVKEKHLQIGKLRHEAVILNDHLIKALRFLRRGKPEDNVDRQLVTNHFLHFLQLDRSDPKKFQILQLIAALLGWDESQKEQAGLLRQGTGFATAGGSLRVPVSPFRRTPSTPSLTGDFMPESPAGTTKESLAELWSEFLEREAESGSTTTGGSRRSSVAKGSMRSPSSASPMGITSPTLPPVRQNSEVKRKESQSAGSVK